MSKKTEEFVESMKKWARLSVGLPAEDAVWEAEDEDHLSVARPSKPTASRDDVEALVTAWNTIKSIQSELRWRNNKATELQLEVQLTREGIDKEMKRLVEVKAEVARLEQLLGIANDVHVRD